MKNDANLSKPVHSTKNKAFGSNEHDFTKYYIFNGLTSKARNKSDGRHFIENNFHR